MVAIDQLKFAVMVDGGDYQICREVVEVLQAQVVDYSKAVGREG